MQILLIGYGAMGQALAKGWGAFCKLAIIDPFKENCERSLEQLPKGFVPDVIVIALKPQVLGQVLPMYAKFESSLFISIAAGVQSQNYKGWLGEEVRLCRAMPNLPVLVGQGASAYLLNENCTATDEVLVRQLFEKVGIVEKLGHEGLFDAVTALSGSGPAYIYYLCEVLSSAGVALGLPLDLAQKFARQIIIGAAATLKKLEDTPAKLREYVTSPGGTTEAALGVLMVDDSLQNLFSKALSAAQRRAQELAN